jgi:tRNA (guanine37-N1)-methyltransferase
MKVPEILLSGNHAKIAQWRRQQSLERTQMWRPDLMERLNHREHRERRDK